MSPEEMRYRFECECNGEIPIGDGPTLSDAKRALADYCKDSGHSPARVLAQLAADLMLSDNSDPLHVWGVEFGRELNEAMKRGVKHEPA